MTTRTASWLAAILLAAGTTSATAADFWADDVATVMRTDTFSAEALAGYLVGSSTESVYRSGGQRLSQLKWDLNSAAVVGGRAAVRPLDWLTFRVKGWATVAADSKLRDYDWLSNYRGFNSFTHISIHPDTVTPQAWSGDVSAAVTYWQDENLALTVLGGYRHYEVKFEGRGGSFLYSEFARFDYAGNFPNGQTGISYRQTWDAPYLGLGTAYASGAWGLSGEIYGSPVAIASDNDDHRLRAINFKGRFQNSSMFGLNGAVEYRFTDNLALVGRFEYQHWSEARGKSRDADLLAGTYDVSPKGSVGASADTAIVSLGIKARL